MGLVKHGENFYVNESSLAYKSHQIILKKFWMFCVLGHTLCHSQD